MTDLEIVKKCAEKMGWREHKHSAKCMYNDELKSTMLADDYNPLTDDAQAMELVKRFKLTIFADFKVTAGGCGEIYYGKSPAHGVEAKDLNRAICECVARL